MENPELGRKILDTADTEPENFDMATWVNVTECGTTACLAGHAMLLSGYTIRHGVQGGLAFCRPDGSEVDVNSNEAQQLLGLSDKETYDPDLDEPRIWYDFAHGPDRLRKLVEEAEGRAS